MSMNITDQKNTLRRDIKAAERAMSDGEKRAADALIIENIISSNAYKNANVIFAFVGMAHEIDTTALLQDILANGKRLCVPLCVGSGIMEVKEIFSLKELHRGAYGILEPSAECRSVSLDEIDLVILPCVSCSHDGRRLGHGGGYYDRFMAQYRGRAILICREALTRENIPTEPHDISCQTVITDAGIFGRNI